VVRKPPLEHEQRPQQLGVVVRFRKVLLHQKRHDGGVEESSAADRLGPEPALELATELGAKPNRDRRGEPMFRAVDEMIR
jgi:hypothetical protein